MAEHKDRLEGALYFGSTVMITGMKEDKNIHLNGKKGRIERYNFDFVGYEVRVVDSQSQTCEHLLLKRENMLLLTL